MTTSLPRKLSRSRFALLVLVGVYPLVTVLLYLIAPLTNDFELWQRTIVLCPIMVIAMVWGVIPAIYRHFGRFIHIPA